MGRNHRQYANSPFAALRCWAHSAMKPNRPMAPYYMGATNLQIGGERHGQDRRPLCKLWWKVRSCLSSPLGAAVLPQSLQNQLPCKNSQGLCAHEKVVWLTSSRGDVDEESASRRRPVVAALTAARADRLDGRILPCGFCWPFLPGPCRLPTDSLYGAMKHSGARKWAGRQEG
jgi:hypothetical protein